MPRSIISDRDPIFISNFRLEFFKLSSTQLKMSSAYHPQTDGQTEIVNRCVEQYLHCLVHQQPRKWYSFLPWPEFWYSCPTLPPLTDDGALIIEPAEIIDTRWLKKLGKFFEECLVKWKHLSVEDAT
uniref:Integrase catalytic domain-containing protein n=1 Tax=Vitis vinifera TaxID=29760 RepID=A5AZN2_VITVI|nr:hypothetical protein VITISV_013568 [Vitis vinifera]